ncbi:TPA: hypothetical protein DEP94_02785 [Candidatus Nomurabacteria bacterium]|nr:hypothetical protein [Candidatus Nomurabacteria bacterium]
MKKVALITVTYNAEKNLSFFLPSLIKNREILSGIFFVDNNSKDKTLKELENFKETQRENFDIDITSNDENYGYAYAINMGIQKALETGYDYFCITNNDLIFEEGFFSQMLEDAVHNNIDALGVPASINENELGLGYKLDNETFLLKESSPLLRNKIAEEILKNPLPQIDAPHGGTILFSRFFFDEIGLYDHHLFFGGDELDFLYRITAHNTVHTPKIKCAVSLKSFLLIDNLSKHNSGHKIIKARGMLQGNARVNLKHRFTPLHIGLYKEQHKLIRGLSKGKIIRYLALYFFAFRGLCIEICKYYYEALWRN